MCTGELVSVVIPFYNHHEFIHECIESIKQQTYKNYEIIIIDDESDPELKLNDMNIFRLVKHTGVAGAMNAGINKARGEYIKLFGADDVAMPFMIEKNLEAIHQTGRKWSCGGLKYINMFSDEIKLQCEVNHFDAITDKNVEQLAVFGPGLGGGSILYDKELFNRHGLLDEKLQCGEDREFWARLFRADELPAYIPDYLYKYRQGSSRARMNVSFESNNRLRALLQRRANEL